MYKNDPFNTFLVTIGKSWAFLASVRYLEPNMEQESYDEYRGEVLECERLHFEDLDHLGSRLQQEGFDYPFEEQWLYLSDYRPPGSSKQFVGAFLVNETCQGDYEPVASFSSIATMRYYLELWFGVSRSDCLMDDISRGDVIFDNVPCPLVVKLTPAKRKKLFRNRALFNPIVKYQPSDTEMVYLGLGQDGWYRDAVEREPGKKPSYELSSPKLDETIAGSISMLTNGTFPLKAVR